MKILTFCHPISPELGIVSRKKTNQDQKKYSNQRSAAMASWSEANNIGLVALTNVGFGNAV